MNDCPINVLHVSTPKSWRGGEQQLYYLYGELEKKYIPQYILCTKGSEVAKRGKKLGWNIIECKKRTSLDLNFALQLKKICQEKNISLVHTHDSHAHTFAILSALFWRNTTPVVVSRRVDFPISKNRFSLYKYNHPIVKKILCVSNAIHKITAVDVKDKNKVITVHSGVDLSKFTAKKENCTLLRNEYNIPSSHFIVGNVAALAPHKDYYTFVDTVEETIINFKNIHFFIIGAGPMESEIKQYVTNKNLDQFISFTGFRSDIPTILPELDAFLITSETEGLGTSVIDAFACEVPVIATKAGGIPELVINEQTGMLSNVKDFKNLSKDLINLLEGKLSHIDFIGNQKQIISKFTKESTADKTLKAYYSIV